MISRHVIEKHMEFGKLKITVCGISMLPKYKEGDTVFVKKIDRKLEVGDVIWFCENNKYIIHRVISIEGDYIITKGDNNKYADLPVNYNNILGIVIDEGKVKKNLKCNINIIINVWKKELYKNYKEFEDVFGITVVCMPGKIFGDGSNICVSKVSTNNLCDVCDKSLGNKIYFHIGVDIANVKGYEDIGMTNDDKFDYVARAGIYSLEEITNIRENTLVIFSSIHSLMKRIRGE